MPFLFFFFFVAVLGFKTQGFDLALVAYGCSPSYAGGRDQVEASPQEVVWDTLSQKNFS
jgi:hypothetical protein